MTTHWGGRVAGALAATILTFTLGACTGATNDAGATSAPSPPAEESATPTPTPTPEPLALTCDGIVTAEVAASFAAEGWTGKAWGDEPWTLGDQTLEGIACIWALDHSVGTDNFIWFGWSPIDEAQKAAAIASLTGSGEYIVDETPDGTYVTIDPSMAVTTDENGYGTTYLFTGGWVAGSATRQDLQLVRVPEGWTPSA